MALTKTLSLVDNFSEVITFPNAYIKVASVASTKETCHATYYVQKTKDGQILEQRLVEFSTDLFGPNAIKQTYEYLKTLPEFADATDC